MTTGIVKRTATYLLIFAVLVGGLNVAYHRQILSKYLLARTDRALALCRSDTEVLFLGDSHVQHGLNPLEIPHAFNFSSQGEHYILNYYKLKTVLAEGKMHPRVIVLPLDLHSFATGTLENHYFRDPWYWQRYVDYVEVARALGDASLAGRMLAAVFPFLGSGTDFFHPIDSNELTPIVKGFVQNRDDFSRNENREEVARIRAERLLSRTTLFDEHLVAYFKKILALAAENRLEVVLVRMPVTRLFYDTACRSIPSVDRFYETVDGMLAPYQNIMVLDYQKCFFGEDNMFWDSDHVNVTGAEYLTLNVWKDYLERSRAGMADGETQEKRREAIAGLRLKIAGLERRRTLAGEAIKVREMYRSGRKADAARLAEAAFRKGNHEYDILTLLLAGLAGDGDAALRRDLAEAVKTSSIPEKLEFSGGRVVALGLTGDFWTTDGNPAFLTVAAPEDRPDRHEFWLSCGADGDVLPLTATIDDGSRQVRHVFRAPARVRISLPEVPSGANRLFVVKTDKTWVPPGGKDTRRLGVRIVPVETDGDPS